MVKRLYKTCLIILVISTILMLISLFSNNLKLKFISCLGLVFFYCIITIFEAKTKDLKKFKKYRAKGAS